MVSEVQTFPVFSKIVSYFIDIKFLSSMAGGVSADQWSIREKLCLASSVIRSGDQNWVSVSRAIKPFGEPGRPPDWFSQKNCACQYSALLETVETPKRKRSERGEVVDTPGDLIVRKMTKERIAELKAQLEKDKMRYQQLQREIEQIRSGQTDDKLQSMWDEIQEQKRAAKEVEEAQRVSAELAKASATAKSVNKPVGFQSSNKRRPPVRNSSGGSRTQSETSSVGENVEIEDTTITSPIKVTDELTLDDRMTKDDDEDSASAFLTSIVAAKLQEDQDAATANQGDEIPTDGEAEEAAEKLLAATASNLAELLGPYPEDSSSSQSIDESSLPTPEVSTPAPRVKEPLILKIEKGVVKTREQKIETNISKSEETEEVEIVNVGEAENDQPPSPDPETTKNVDLTSMTKPKTDPGDEDVEPPSPEDGSSRDEGGIKIRRKAARGRPSASQRKSSRIRTQATAEEEEDPSLPETAAGRRSAGKDSTVGTITSLIDDDSKDTHSEAGDSDVTDKPSESDRDDLSTAAAGTLQSVLLLDSLPSSPASVAQSEEDHAYKIWRKAIMLVWRAIASHKYANVFLHPVTEDIAPGYKSIVLRPMDLITIKKNIENGVIRTTEQFHRDMMLMFQNAIMYNNADQHVHQIATIMQADVVKQVEEFISTQLLVHQPDSTKMLRGRGKQGQVEEERSRRSSTDTDTSGKKRRTRADEN